MITRDEILGRKVAVLLGGKSSEREVSERSGGAMLRALRERGYDAVPVDPAEDVAEQLHALDPAAAVVGLHGRWGEDGCIQGLLECLRIPYTGSGVLASSMGLDKVASKHLFASVGLPTPEYLVVPRDRGDEVDASRIPFGLPAVVKPAREGSSVGVTVVREAAEFREAVAFAAGFAGDVLVERCIEGREVSVVVLDGEALGTIEIRPKRAFYDYEAKYDKSSGTEYLCPAPLEGPLLERVQEVAEQAHRALGCSGVTRSDFMVTARDGWLIEVNTLPGMTETSLVPKVASRRGISFGELCERLLLGASLKS